MNWPVEALLGGTARPFRADETSAIAKTPLPGRVAITRLGLAGDTQADRVHHGGPDMALHLYPLDHHAFWRENWASIRCSAIPARSAAIWRYQV